MSSTSPARQLFPHVRRHALRRRVARLDHRQQDAVEREPWILAERRANAAQDLRRRLQRERLALQRHEHVLAAREHAMHDGAESRRRVHDDGVAALPRPLEQLRGARRLGELADDSARASSLRSRCRRTRRAARAGASCARPRASRACRRGSRTGRCACSRASARARSAPSPAGRRR